MSVITALVSPFIGVSSLRRFTVDEYHQLIETGILDDEDRVELLEGYVVLKMPRNPPHDGSIDLVLAALRKRIPSGWALRSQQAITLSDSEPEPDSAVARGNERSYVTRHPGPADLGLVIEVADSTLGRDRVDKVRLYARANIIAYWIVNIADRQVEVYTSPSGAVAVPSYAQRQDYLPGDSVPLILDGVQVGAIPVQELLP